VFFTRSNKHQAIKFKKKSGKNKLKKYISKAGTESELCTRSQVNLILNEHTNHGLVLDHEPTLQIRKKLKINNN